MAEQTLSQTFTDIIVFIMQLVPIVLMVVFFIWAFRDLNNKNKSH